MGAPESNPRSGNNAMLLVCDATGRVQATTSKAGMEVGAINTGQEDFAQFFGLNAAVNQWFVERMQEANESADYSAEANLDLEDGDTHVFVRVDRLKCENEHYRFALQLCPAGPELAEPEPSEPKPSEPKPSKPKLGDGDSVVTRKQWHEIKNHIGALRLYATFLKRRMPEGDERQIVEKVLQGVNVLIGYLDRVRRGDPE